MITQVAPGIRAIQVPEPDNPHRPVCTNIYLVGHTRLTMIDTGVEEPRFAQALFGGLLELGAEYRVTAAAITHSHLDHCGGMRWVRETLEPQLYAHANAVPVVQPRVKNSPLQALEEGSVIDADGVELQVLFTPGHNGDSVCYYHRESGIVLAGDTILGRGTTTVADLGSYMQSLERLAELSPTLICPGHGPMVEEPERVLREYIDHRNMRERQIVEELQRSPRTVNGLVTRLYKEIDTRLRRSAARNVTQHLLKLQNEGRVEVEGKGARARYYWRRS